MADDVATTSRSENKAAALGLRLPGSVRNVLAIAEREIRSYFVSPVAWVVTAMFISIWGLIFWASLTGSREAVLRPLLDNVRVIFIFAAPLMTMRLIAEEASTGTLEVLLTQPLREAELVLGKYLGSTVFLLFILAMTLYFPLLLEMFGNPDEAVMVAGYLAVLLQGMAFLAIGLVASAVAPNQIIAVAVSFVTLLLLWLFDLLSRGLGGVAGQVAQYISVTKRIEDMPRGVIDTKDVVFFLTIIIVCLFITIQIIGARRWR